MPEKLKPCPFCGGEACFKIISHGSCSRKVSLTFEIACKECKISFPKRYHTEFTLGETGELEAYVDPHQTCEMFSAPNENIGKILAFGGFVSGIADYLKEREP